MIRVFSQLVAIDCLFLLDIPGNGFVFDGQSTLYVTIFINYIEKNGEIASDQKVAKVVKNQYFRKHTQKNELIFSEKGQKTWDFLITKVLLLGVSAVTPV